MSLKNIDLTTALRPDLLPDEVLLFVQDNVGLYEGKFKIPNYQNGHAYLTSHRICYVDNEEPRKHSVGIDLKEVERYEFYAGFLKSSAKITLVPKALKRLSIQNRNLTTLNTPSRSATSSPGLRSDTQFHLPAPDSASARDATWVCPICTFSNPVPSNFDPATANIHTPLPPCLACGIKPPLAHVLKAAVSNATGRATPAPAPVETPIIMQSNPLSAYHSVQDLDITSTTPDKRNGTSAKRSTVECPRCTFLNHSSLRSCELCGASLTPQTSLSTLEQLPARTESPGPTLQTQVQPGSGIQENIKVSFRGGGEKIFYERLKGALTQRKWLLHNARPVPKPGQYVDGDEADSSPVIERIKTVGIAGLEQRRLNLRKNNEVVIGSAFEDLEALMTSAKEIVALAESFARQTNSHLTGSEENALLAQSASALGLVTTKDMLSSGSASDTLYLSELARNLAEFLTDDARGILRKSGGIMTLVDLWAIFNRARGGVELISPNDFEKAAHLWEKLKLPVRLRKFKSGVLVVQSADRTDEKTIKTLLAWLAGLHSLPPEKEVAWEWQVFGRGITVRDAADHFGWSIGVATEELEMAEESGVLCREESVEGLKYWENWIGTMKSKAIQIDPMADLESALIKEGMW